MQLSSQHAARGARLTPAPVRQVRGRQQAVCVQARAAKAGVGLLGTKVGMSTLWNKAGRVECCTIIGLESPNYVTQRFTEERDGREAIQVRQGCLSLQPRHIAHAAATTCCA